MGSKCVALKVLKYLIKPLVKIVIQHANVNVLKDGLVNTVEKYHVKILHGVASLIKVSIFLIGKCEIVNNAHVFCMQ